MIYAAYAAYCLLVTVVTLIIITVLVFAAGVLGSVYAKNLFRAGDKTFAALLGFDGFMTLSAECGNPDAGPWWHGVGDVIDTAFGDGHCEEAWLRERQRMLRGTAGVG